MITPMLGKITLFPYDYAPDGWMFCDGSKLPISENEALFQLLGFSFGGDGESNFGIPDLRSVTPADCHYCIAVRGQSHVTLYEGLVGETFLLPFQPVARDLVECTGQSVSKNTYPFLSALIGTRFGGDSANLNLPDLRSKTPNKHRSMIAVQGFEPNAGLRDRNPYVGELFLLPYDAIENFIVCNGSLLSVNGNQVLFTLLGVRFGGDPRRFAVPDLRAVAPAKYNYFLARTGTFPSRP